MFTTKKGKATTLGAVTLLAALTILVVIDEELSSLRGGFIANYRRRDEKNMRGLSVSKSGQQIEARCIVNEGKAFVNERDPLLGGKMEEAINEYKQSYDEHQLPAIEVVAPSFHFVTTVPFGSTSNQPVLSRAWNESFAVTDDASLHGQVGNIWGSTGFDDEYIRHYKGGIDNGRVRPDIILPPGKYVAFSGWYRGNFGHYLHDHISKIAWLRHLFLLNDDGAKIILPYHKVHEDALTVVDEEFVRNHVIWVNYGQVVAATHSSSLTVMKPKSNFPFPHGFPQTATVYTEYFRQWLEESHWMQSSQNSVARNEGKVIYYTRTGGGAVRRQMNKEIELQILSKIREAMKRRGQDPEKDLIIFDGTDEYGNTLPIQTQFELFSSADTAIGPHGSGLANIIWMDPRCNTEEKRAKVIEFVSSERTAQVHHGSFWGHWYLFGSLPWVDCHEMYYLEGSDDTPGSDGLFIDIDMFERTLNDLWGNSD